MRGRELHACMCGDELLCCRGGCTLPAPGRPCNCKHKSRIACRYAMHACLLDSSGIDGTARGGGHISERARHSPQPPPDEPRHCCRMREQQWNDVGALTAAQAPCRGRELRPYADHPAHWPSAGPLLRAGKGCRQHLHTVLALQPEEGATSSLSILQHPAAVRVPHCSTENSKCIAI